MYKCPYCNKSEYTKTRGKEGPFTSWEAIRYHIPTCNLNTRKYYICLYYGPILYSEFVELNRLQIHKKYPNLTGNLSDIKRLIVKKLELVDNYNYQTSDVTKQFIIEKIKEWYTKFGRIPENRDWYNSQGGEWPNHNQLYKLFGSWNNAIIAAGFKPNIQNGFGTIGKAKDNNNYRSLHEVWFVENILIPSTLEYKYEILYPKPYSDLLYDFYLPELDLYIEIDGGLRPKSILNKIKINKELNRKLLVINSSDLRRFTIKQLFDCAQV